MATPGNLCDFPSDNTSDESSSSEESAEEGEFEIVQTSTSDSIRLPKFNVCGTLSVEGSSDQITLLATNPKETEEIYFTSRNDNNILVTSLHGDVATKLDSSKILLEIQDFAVSDNGNVVVVGKTNEIRVYDRDGNMVNSFQVSLESKETMVLENGTGSLEIISVDIDRNRKISIGCCQGNRKSVLIYEIDGEFKRKINVHLQPVFISSRYLLVAVSEPKKRAVEVRHNDASGELIRMLQMRDLGPSIEPCGILLTWDHLFVVTKNAMPMQSAAARSGHKSGAVHLYDTNSMVYLGVIVSQLSNPCAIDITPADKLVLSDGNDIKIFER